MHARFSGFQSWRNDPARIRLRGKDRILFAKRLSLYLRAGIPLLEALDVIRDASGNGSSAKLILTLMRDVRSGLPLSRSLRRFPRAFSPFHIQMIVIGESSGTLSDSLARLTDALERNAARVRSLRGMLAYPSILFIGSLGVSGFLILYAFPKIVPIFRGLHAQLPFTTRALIAISQELQRHGILLGAGAALGLPIIIRVTRLRRVRERMDPFLLRLPFVGKLLQGFALVFAFRTVATLARSGARLDHAILITRDGVRNTAYKKALDRALESVLAGGKLSSVLRANPRLFPPVAIQLISMGEMTGALPESAEAAAGIFEEDLAEQLRIASSLLEPLIMCLMGLIVGFVALAIISPMYGITQNLSV